MTATHAPSDGELVALLAQCTIEEKIALLSLKNVWETADVDRLDIPSLKVLYFFSRTLINYL